MAAPSSPVVAGKAIVRSVFLAVGLASASAGPTAALELAPAPYKPLPVGATITFDDRVFEVTESDGLEILFKTRSAGDRGWLRRSTRKEEWLRVFALFGEFGNNMHVFDTRGDQIDYTLDDGEREKLKALWPLKVGNSATFELEEGKGECTDPDEWVITLTVERAEMATIGGFKYPTFVIRESGKSESGKVFEGRRWYQPDAGIIVKAEREWVKSFPVRPIAAEMSGMAGAGGFGGAAFGGGFAGAASALCAGTNDRKEPQFGEGERDDFALVSVRFPEGTTTHALNRTRIGGDTEAAAAEVRELKREVAGLQTAQETANAPAAAAAPGLEGVDFGRYHALVIGIGGYKHMAKLETAVSDAKAVAEVLERDYGFKVTTLIDPDRAAIIDSLDERRESLGAGDNLLIYYAGRGWLDEEADRGYWLPVDAETNRRSGWVSNADITDTLKTLQAKHVIVIADSCFSGTLSRAASADLRSGDYWKRMAGKWARVAITSGGLEPGTGKGGLSPFAGTFLDVLGGNDGILDGQQLFGKMRRPLMLGSDRTPRYADVRNAGHDGGDFLFVRRK